MQRRAIRNSCAAVLLISAIVLTTTFCGRGNDFHVSPQITSSVRSGDVVLLEGTSWRGRIVRFLNSKSDFSHVGVVKIEEGKVFLLHADPKLGCVQEEIHHLFQRCRFLDAVVLRPKDAAAAFEAVSFCSRAVSRHTRFNDSFRYLQGSGFYCTEFVLMAYESAGTHILSGIQKGAIIFPEQLLGSDALAKAQKEEPNQPPEPTSTAGTSAAAQPRVPAALVAHL